MTNDILGYPMHIWIVYLYTANTHFCYLKFKFDNVPWTLLDNPLLASIVPSTFQNNLQLSQVVGRDQITLSTQSCLSWTLRLNKNCIHGIFKAEDERTLKKLWLDVIEPLCYAFSSLRVRSEVFFLSLYSVMLPITLLIVSIFSIMALLLEIGSSVKFCYGEGMRRKSPERNSV